MPATDPKRAIEAVWKIEAPNLIAGTLFTIVMLLSEIPNTMVKKAANGASQRIRIGGTGSIGGLQLFKEPSKNNLNTSCCD